MITILLCLFIVTVSGHNHNRINPLKHTQDECEIRSFVNAVKESLAEAVLEKCLTSPNYECVPVATIALQPCLRDAGNSDQQCFSDALKQAQIADFEDCFCGGVSALVESLDTVAPLVCSSADIKDKGSRGGRVYESWAAASGSSAKPMIIDTDMTINVNDPLALCAAHAIEKEGYAKIKAVVSNVGYPKSIGAVSVINHYFGRDHIKLGAYKGDFGDFFNGHHVLDNFVNDFPSPVKDYNSVDDAVDTIRNTLSEAEDDTIVYVAIGFLVNLRDFLATAEDRELFAKKVKIVFIMGGKYPEDKSPEFHFGCGVSDGQDTYSNTDKCQGSAKAAIEKIPESVPVRFLGQKVGEDVWTGGSLWSWCKAYSTKNPCFRALTDWESETGNKTTLSWDPMTVTAAAGSVMTVGSALEGWNGRIKVEEDGTNSWEDGFPDSKQLYLCRKNKYLPIVQLEKLYCMSNLYSFY